MTDQPPPLDAVTEALRLLDTAQTYGYEVTASYQAALAHLDGLDADQLRETAAAAAAMVARYTMLESWARGRRPVPDLDMWVRHARHLVAQGEQP